MQVACYGYRYYDPLTGRWPSRDPIEEIGWLWCIANILSSTAFSEVLDVPLRDGLVFLFSDDTLSSNLTINKNVNVYLFSENSPVFEIDVLGLDVYKINRKLGATEADKNTAKCPCETLSHTFIGVVDKKGKRHTYSWGNTGSGTCWASPNRPEDMNAFKEALANGKAWKVYKGHDKDKAVADAHKNGRSDPGDNHPNLFICWNCKAEANELLREVGINPWPGTSDPLDTP